MSASPLCRISTLRTLCVAVALVVLSACVFSSEKPLLPKDELATPLAAGSYVTHDELVPNGSLPPGAMPSDVPEGTETVLTLNADRTYWFSDPEAGVRLVSLYRLTPVLYLAQRAPSGPETNKPITPEAMTEPMDPSYEYGLVEVLDNGKAYRLYALECDLLTPSERIKLGARPSVDAKRECGFDNLDLLVRASFYMINRGLEAEPISRIKGPTPPPVPRRKPKARQGE